MSASELQYIGCTPDGQLVQSTVLRMKETKMFEHMDEIYEFGDCLNLTPSLRTISEWHFSSQDDEDFLRRLREAMRSYQSPEPSS